MEPNLAADVLRRAQVIHLQPADVLVFSNVGEMGEHDDGADIKKALGVKRVVFFEEDVNIALLRTIEQCPDCSRPEGWDACPVHRGGE